MLLPIKALPVAAHPWACSWWLWVEVGAGTATAAPRALLEPRGEAEVGVMMHLGMRQGLARQARATVAELVVLTISILLAGVGAGLGLLDRALCLRNAVEMGESASSQVLRARQHIMQVVEGVVATIASRALEGLEEEARVGLSYRPRGPSSSQPRVRPIPAGAGVGLGVGA